MFSLEYFAKFGNFFLFNVHYLSIYTIDISRYIYIYIYIFINTKYI